MENVKNVLRDIIQVNKGTASLLIPYANSTIIWANVLPAIRVMKLEVGSAQYLLLRIQTAGKPKMEYVANVIKVFTIILMTRHVKELILSVRQQTKQVGHALAAIQDII